MQREWNKVIKDTIKTALIKSLKLNMFCDPRFDKRIHISSPIIMSKLQRSISSNALYQTAVVTASDMAVLWKCLERKHCHNLTPALNCNACLEITKTGNRQWPWGIIESRSAKDVYSLHSSYSTYNTTQNIEG